MIPLTIKKNYLLIRGFRISFELFNYLTGKGIDFSKRINKKIFMSRCRGHLYLYDENFIVGELYSHNDHESKYKCKCIYKTDNESILEPLWRKKVKLIYSNNPLEWRIR